jgi:hypothetical protein
VTVRSIDEFDMAVDRVTRLAHGRGVSFQVDLKAYPPRRGDPVLIQFLVGDHERGSLLWHEDGIGFAAVSPGLRPRACDTPFVRFHGAEAASAAETQIGQRTAIDAVVVYLLTGERVQSLEWREIEAG